MSKKVNEKDKIGKFYTFEVTDERLKRVEQLTRKNYIKHFRNAFILGFCVELMITKTKICTNINITRGLNLNRCEHCEKCNHEEIGKKKEDDNLKERKLLQLQEKSATD